MKQLSSLHLFLNNALTRTVTVLVSIFSLLIILPCRSQAQIVEIESTSEGVILPKMTEAQRDAIVTKPIGTLIFQTDGSVGYYYYDGQDLVPLGASTSVAVTINGMTPESFGLNYVGPATASNHAHRFVSSTGYYVDIQSTDSISHHTIYYSGTNCSGTTHVDASKVGLGGVMNGNDQLYYVAKNASMVAQISYMSRLIFNPGQAPNCFASSGTAELMYPLTINNSGITQITLNPSQSYSIAYE